MGEQLALRPDDVDWKAGVLHVKTAITRDENGKRVEGRTKNRYSRRQIKLLHAMHRALSSQREIQSALGSEYLFCTTTGRPIDINRLTTRVWIPALKRAGVPYREMKQTRHTFATMALGCGENPLWIANVMGHRNTDMIIRVYGKYMGGNGNAGDGARLNGLLSQGCECSSSVVRQE